MLVAKRRPPTISTEVQYKDVKIHHPIVFEKPLDLRIAHRKSERIMIIPHKSDMHQEFVVLVSTVPPVKYRFVLTVNQTAGTLGTQKTELVYASISLCLDIIKIDMLWIVLALVIVRQSDHNLF